MLMTQGFLSVTKIIIGGDFNLVLNIDMDKKGGLARTHLKSQETVKDRAAQFDLVDAWRTINLDSGKYTWRHYPAKSRR